MSNSADRADLADLAARLVFADMVAERDCVELMHRYCRLIDSGHASQVADLFTATGTWTLGKTVVRGTVALRDSFTQREETTGRTTRHVLTNLEVTLGEAGPDGQRGATGVGYLTAYRYDANGAAARYVPLAGPVMVGDVNAEFARHEGSWLISRLRTTAAFVRHDDPVGVST